VIRKGICVETIMPLSPGNVAQTGEGKIYILRNPYLKDALVKIGRTRCFSEQRADEISRATGVPGPYEVLYEEDVRDCKLAEALIHIRLLKYRVNPRREFFRLPLKLAVRKVFEVCMELNKDVRPHEERRLVIYMVPDVVGKQTLEKIRAMVEMNKGDARVYLFLELSGGPHMKLRLPARFRVQPTITLLKALRKMEGISDIDLVVRQKPPRSRGTVYV